MRKLTTSVRRKERKIKVTCSGGPYSGQTIELSDSIPRATAYFRVASWGKELGRYRQSAERPGMADWETKI